MRIRSTKGFTLIELLVVVLIVAVIAAIAIPSLVRARMSGNEAAAIASLRTINSSQQAYSSSCANGFYAPSLVVLGTAPTGGAAFISPDLSAAITLSKSGYTIGMTGIASATPSATVACNAVAAASLAGSYWSSASPTSPGFTGTRHFWTNTLGTIYTQTSSPITDTVGDTIPAAGPTPLQ